MSRRLNYSQAAPEFFKKFQALSQVLQSDPLNQELGNLIDIRSSQLNGCAFCLDMHVKQAKLQGERELRLHHIAIWRESTLFNARERAVLEWTEALTQLPPHGISDTLYEAVREVFSEEELAALTFRIVSINGWNRLSIAFRNPPGSMDKLLGLDKAGLN
ncbi:MAG: carboxymuconolactone decarboxylase family protein [Castellaniella sp.]